MLAASPDFDRLLGFVIADINHLLRREFDRRVHGLGLTHAQWLILYEVAPTKPAPRADCPRCSTLAR
jgi:hypothetical protein